MTETRTERRSALDKFADLGNEANAANAPARASIYAPPIEHVYGAQKVAVHRDERLVLARLRELAAAAGDNWFYRFPVRNKKENRIDYIEGPSIKLANDLARIYGNCEIDVRVFDAGDSWVFYARFHDLETGFSLTRPFQQRKSGGKIGGMDDERRLDIAFQIGGSKAIRNVVCNALQTLSDFAFEAARDHLIEEIGKDLPKWRKRAIEAITPLVSIDRVVAVIGRAPDEWLAPDVARIRAMIKTIRDGMASLDETFPPIAKEDEAATDDLDTFAEGEQQEDQQADQQQDSPPTDNGDEKGDVDSPAHTHANATSSDTADAETLIPASAAHINDMVDQLMLIAADRQLAEQDRLERLDVAMVEWQEQLPDHAEFVRQCVETAASVASGKTKVDAARRYLASLQGKQP